MVVDNIDPYKKYDHAVVIDNGTYSQVALSDDKNYKVFIAENVILRDHDISTEEVPCCEPPGPHGVKFQIRRNETLDFVCNNVITAENAELILTDEILQKIKEYNIDAKHRALTDENLDLETRRTTLLNQIQALRFDFDRIDEIVQDYRDTVEGMIHGAPTIAAEYYKNKGDLDVAIDMLKRAEEIKNKYLETRPGLIAVEIPKTDIESEGS